MQVRVQCEACGGTGRNDTNRDDVCPVCAGAGHLLTPWVVEVFDRAGQFSTTPCTDFQAVLATFREARAAHPGKAVLAFNLDRCDVDSDGLTDGEHEALDDVLVADVGIAWDEAKEGIARLLRAAGAR